MEGWIKLNRKILMHPFWQEKPFDKRSAFIDLVLLANHQENEVMIGNIMVTVKRGSLLTSEVKLGNRWGWSRQKVRSYLRTLDRTHSATKVSTSNYTVITLENYDLYQGEQPTNNHQKNIKKTAKKQQKNTNKNVKNEKNEKNEKNILNTLSGKTDEIITYLNEKANKKFKSTTPNTVKLIKARLKEGFTVEDFKTVIDTKVNQWLKNDKMVGYLRPTTLFSTKFEGYLNETQNDWRDDFLNE